jgi:tight adherence protein B
MMDNFNILLLAGLGGGFLLLVGFLLLDSGGGKAAGRRLQGLRDRHGSNAAKAATEAQIRKALALRPMKMDESFSRLIPSRELFRRRLSQTGKDWSVNQYMIAIAVIGVSVTGIFLWLGMTSGLMPILAAFLGAAAGFGIPHLVINVLINRRIADFVAKFPDAIDLMVRGLRSGFPIGETMGIVASEVPGAVGVEFRSVSDGMKIGKTMDNALQEVAHRLGTPEFQFFVISLAIQRETGGNLAETLANLGDVLRKRAQMKLKIKAMSSEAKASAYIIGALPFFVFGAISFLSPNYMAGFFTDTRLMIAAGGGAIWMSIGAYIMREMINFEI